MKRQLTEELLIVSIQIGGVKKLQKIIEQILERNFHFDCFQNVMAIMGIGVVSEKSFNLIHEKRKET